MGGGGFTLKDDRPVQTFEIVWQSDGEPSGRAFVEAPGPTEAIAQAHLLELDDPADTAVAAKALREHGTGPRGQTLDVRLDPA